MKMYMSEASGVLAEHFNHFGIKATEDNINRLTELIQINAKLKRKAYLPDFNIGESEDDYIVRIYKTSGLIDAIQATNRFKELNLLEARAYVYNLLS